MSRIVMMLFVLLLAGCASEPVVFEKAGAGPTEFEQDKYDCKVQMDQSSGAIAYRQDPLAHLYYPAQARQDLLNCLNRKGWTPQPAAAK